MLRELQGFAALVTGDRVSTELRRQQASRGKAGRLSGATLRGGIPLDLGSWVQASPRPQMGTLMPGAPPESWHWLQQGHGQSAWGEPPPPTASGSSTPAFHSPSAAPPRTEGQALPGLATWLAGGASPCC